MHETNVGAALADEYDDEGGEVGVHECAAEEEVKGGMRRAAERSEARGCTCRTRR
jgi:hypothetical protein